jgi:hypothetical protein
VDIKKENLYDQIPIATTFKSWMQKENPPGLIPIATAFKPWIQKKQIPYVKFQLPRLLSRGYKKKSPLV